MTGDGHADRAADSAAFPGALTHSGGARSGGSFRGNRFMGVLNHVE